LLEKQRSAVEDKGRGVLGLSKSADLKRLSGQTAQLFAASATGFEFTADIVTVQEKQIGFGTTDCRAHACKGDDHNKNI